MTRPFVTASAIERVMECPASAVLPQTQNTSTYAKSGRDTHSDIEGLILGRIERTSNGLTGEMLGAPTGAVPEVAFCYDVLTGEAKELGRVGDRNYPPSSPSTIMGTVDAVSAGFIAIDAEGDRPTTVHSADVVDWKTSYEPPPPDSWQMRLLGFMAAKARGLPYARTRITHIRGTAVNHSHWKLWGAASFVETERLLKNAYEAVQRLGRKPEITLADVRHGPHCHFCPAYLSCPYPKALLGHVTDSAQAAMLTNHDAAIAYGKWQALRTLSGRLEDALKQYASQKPVDLGNGNLWGKPSQASTYRKFKVYSSSDE